MTSWKSEADIVNDLNQLSAISSGRRVKHGPRLSPIGRGKPVESESPIDFDPFEVTNYRNKSSHVPLTMGRGRMLASMSLGLLSYKESVLQSHLREACGAGFSNELIEAEFGHTSSDESAVFEDAAVPDEDRSFAAALPSVNAGLGTEAMDCEPVHPEPEVNPESLSAESSENLLPVLPRKPRRCNNALLNSLARVSVEQVSNRKALF